MSGDKEVKKNRETADRDIKRINETRTKLQKVGASLMLKGRHALTILLLHRTTLLIEDSKELEKIYAIIKYLHENLDEFKQITTETGYSIEFTTITDIDANGENTREKLLWMFYNEPLVSFELQQLREHKDGTLKELKVWDEVDKKLEVREKELEKKRKELEKREKALEKREKKNKPKKNVRIALHTINQFFGDNKQLSIFSDEKVKEFTSATGLSIIKSRPESYGIVLNQSQERVFYGIINAFSDTNYKGDELKKKEKALGDIYTLNQTSKETLVINENAPYKNIDAIPVVRLTQAEIIRLSGYDRTFSEKTEVINAIEFLATNQFCFYWLRAKTENGKIVKDKNGDYIKEEVMEVGTLLRIKAIRKDGELQYYEIHPSAPLLDQVNSYFLLVPNDWREEVKEITGKRASKYTYDLLLWLRREYEQIRRYNKSGGAKRKPKAFRITKSWEEIAIALKMPETMYKRNKPRTYKTIQGAYSVAIKLGYLLKVENDGINDVLYLNEDYYPKPGKLI